MEKENLEFNVVIEQDEDGIYVARVPELEGCYTQGKTVEEVVSRIKEAIEVCLKGDDDIIPMKFIGLQRVQVEKENQNIV
ncbi:MAG: type II toxin-antitoxin system HicB family antitoxin [Nanoarchaeota archaeon]|nr:type II toxin-antitoxin system HicB family antitoxin [Nanoarchaeota archaeon]